MVAEPERFARGGGKEQVVYVFQPYGTGANPIGKLVSDGRGGFYSSTFDGGVPCAQFSCGTIVKLTPQRKSYSSTILYRFQNNGDGYFANSLIIDAAGEIFGTSGCCYYGQQGYGIFFKITPHGHRYKFTTLFAFSHAGPIPNQGLLDNKTGTFYATEQQGGAHGYGAVFKLAPGAGGYAATTLYSFKGGLDGANPAAGLTPGKSGRLYGTTVFGGSTGSTCNQGFGCGTVFELVPNGRSYIEHVLYKFRGGSDGNQPFAPLVRDVRGNLFGTTKYGGNAPACFDGCGTVFELQRPTGADVSGSYTERVLYNFSGTGEYPTEPVIVFASGTLYGTTTQGGPRSNGTVFRLTPSSNVYVESDVYLFQGPPNDGESPSGLTSDRRSIGAASSLVGTTYFGGSGACGHDLGCGVMFVLRGIADS
jgi:uncharacterized repeat protein (TIGR03803 family)